MKKSRYIVKAPSHDGRTNIFYNLKNGIGIKIPKEYGHSCGTIEKHDRIAQQLQEKGFYSSENETDDLLKQYQDYRSNSPLHLIILPHENCNFRCVYCYEKFEKNKMSPEVEQGILNYVEKELSSGRHKVFSVSWFGGEPLLAIDVIERLSQKFLEWCNTYNVVYVSTITTNAFLLSEENQDVLFKSKVSSFQITIDGIQKYHDQQRILKGGQPTYDQIINNLISLSRRTDRFTTLLRMNVGPENLANVEQHIQEMKKLFGHDARFMMHFQNIGHYGGDNDSEIDICSENMAVKLTNMTLDAQMNAIPISIKIRKYGTCYAASPKSFVIGTDGIIYKCTVALYDERNQVGRLLPDGNLVLNEELMNLWTKSGLEDDTCRQCFFAPSCQGDSCPLIRIEENRRPCPTSKGQITDILTLMDRQSHDFKELDLLPVLK